MDETAPGEAGDRPPCPSRPTSTDPGPLGFVRRPMVRWLDPHQLVDTAARVLLAGTFSAYADNRELQALYPCEVVDRSEGPELWFDYVADLGDGWNSTYTVAHLLAAELLKLEFDGETHATERGRLLVMGGDQVYPVPKRVEYENRLLGPYRSALPCPPGQGDPPELFAIPGSHDWYDGLLNFTSVFCRDRWIGGWRTRQRRSYFAVAMPAGWWLWGVDIQFGSYLDEAQIQYFADVARERLQEGDRILLCIAKEVESGRSSAEVHSDRDIGYLEREVIQPAGGRLVVVLKSGRHHYARYEEDGGARQHITSGGGGAFLHPTHLLPEGLSVPGKEGATRYRRAGVYPAPERSRSLRKVCGSSSRTTSRWPACWPPCRSSWPSCWACTSTSVTSTWASATYALPFGRARPPSCSSSSCWASSPGWCAWPTTPPASPGSCSAWSTPPSSWAAWRGCSSPPPCFRRAWGAPSLLAFLGFVGLLAGWGGR